MTQADSGEVVPPRHERSGGPDSPLDLGKSGWMATLKRAGKEFAADRATLTAAALAYHWFLALVPALIALIGLVKLLNLGTSTIHTLVTGIGQTMKPAQGLFQQAFTAASSKASGATTALILGVAIAVWSASGGMAALETGLDVAYDVGKDRKFIGKRLRALVMMVATIILGGIAAALIVAPGKIGSVLSGALGVSAHATAFVVVWTIVRWVIALIALSLLLSFYYFYGPNRPSPTWKWVSAGGVIATLIIIAATIGFSFYAQVSGSYSKTYGSLASVVVMIFWLFLIGVAILLGAEINAETEREAAAQAGHPGARRSAARIENQRR